MICARCWKLNIEGFMLLYEILNLKKVLKKYLKVFEEVIKILIPMYVRLRKTFPTSVIYRVARVSVCIETWLSSYW